MTEKNTKPVIYRKDYKAPAFFIDRTDLVFEIDELQTRVESTLKLVRNAELKSLNSDLVLDGEHQKLIAVSLDDQLLDESAYTEGAGKLTILSPPDSFTLKIVTEIHPAENLALEGLYLSDGMFCTQCEAEGFRRITYYLDRPDVMSVFTVKIVADKRKYPVLLSNGNKMSEGDLEDGRHWVEWHDPHKKPCYLFALVAGDLDKVEDSFTTMPGREVKLQIYVESKDLDKCDHAMMSLKNAMLWDEKEYGREYDLDLYMIVAVDFFNMGAMENKGLNIFNTSCVLAHKDTQTDAAFQRVEAVIAHEYFHNWSGNRVTCRDWFQLSLKEGFTVFRDACFSADMNSAGVKRIEDASVMRSAQFAEDAGPMAHPIRPDSFIEISNFYTLTIYEKGAEVIRMMQRLLGKEVFRQGCDLYFRRHDGQAVTCEDFILAMEDSSGMDLQQFRNWYSQAGTPQLSVTDSWDAATGTYTISFVQSCPPTPGQAKKKPFAIPVDIALHNTAMNAGGSADIREELLVVDEPKQSFEFSGYSAKPLPALLRAFSAPVNVEYDYSDQELLHLIEYEKDGFVRWDASRRYFISLIADNVSGEIPIDSESGRGKLNSIASLMAKLLLQGIITPDNNRQIWDSSVDAAMLAELIALPGYDLVMAHFDEVPIAKLCQSMALIRQHYANSIITILVQVYEVLDAQLGRSDEYRPNAEDIALRSLKNTALKLLLQSNDDQAGRHIASAKAQFQQSSSMTDQFSALQALVYSNVDTDNASAIALESLKSFYQQWKDESLVVNQWFSVQASENKADTLDKVKSLQKHAAYDATNPNKVRALIGGFCNGSPVAFHSEDGSGYEFLRDEIVRLDALNPQLAARMLTPITKWKRFAKPNRDLMRGALDGIRQSEKLSADVYEVVSKSLNNY